MIYLDHCATTPLRPEVWEAMVPYLRDRFGNPSSAHAWGRAAREAVEAAREKVAALIGAAPDEIVFTSGGTEADNLAIRGTVAARGSRGGHVVTTAIEHHAVLNTLRGLEKTGLAVTYLPVDARGSVSAASVVAALRDDTVLVSVMHGNNEIGTVQPVAEIGAVLRGRGILFHTDAVQTAGKVVVDVVALNVDLLSLSAHKLNGPKGVGALYIRRGVEISPLITGGHQEGGVRGGTENVAAIVGFGRACDLARQELAQRSGELRALRDHLLRRVREEYAGVSVNGDPVGGLPHVLSLSFGGLKAQEIVSALDQEGIAVSAGSACTSGRTEISHVLAALGIPSRDAMGTIRLSVGWGNTGEEMDKAARVLAGVIKKLEVLRDLEAAAGGRGCF